MAERMTKEQIAAAIRAANATPVADNDNPAHWVCLVCDQPGEFTADLLPSGTRHKIRCAQGHVTQGIPAPAFRI